MSMDNLAAETRAAIAAATKVAQSLGHREVRPEHLLIGLFSAPESTPARILMGYGLFSQMATARIAAIAPPGSVPAGSSLFSEAARTAIATASRYAEARGNRAVDVNSLAVALLESDAPLVAEVLASVNVAPQTVLAALEAALPPAPDPTSSTAATPDSADTAAIPGAGDALGAPEAAAVGSGGLLDGPSTSVPLGKALSTYGENLVEKAINNGFDKVTGRENELERVMIILGRRAKNNPVLIGEPGVGKTAVAEALAERVAFGNVPDVLKDRPVIALDLAGMLAGARSRGDFEERLKHVIAEAQNIHAILFIDEIHQATGAGGGGGAMDATNLLKPMLARGEISVLGATTLDEYRKHIESDAALERRFQPILVGEPTVEETIAILTTLRPAYAAHHGVVFTDAALKSAAELSHRYITDRFLPDKAIDVLDESGAAAGMKIRRLPEEVRNLYLSRAKAQAEMHAAVVADDLVVAAEVSGTVATLAARLAEHTTDGDLSTVDAGHVADVVAAMTGIPVSTVGAEESERLKQLPEFLSTRVIGQPDAIATVSRAVRRIRQGLSSPTRPASFIFAGSTGVGKTHLSKGLAEFLFGENSEGRGSFIQLDMSEYAEKASVSKLFGAPPGYVGHEEGGQLTELVRRNPYAVILLDEVEKAHPEVFDTLLQVLEEGRMTDGQGRSVNFANTVLILTTNLGSGHQARPSLGFGANDTQSLHAAAEKRTLEAIKAHFRPEFLNRIDETVVFRALERSHMDEIVETLLAPVHAQLADLGIAMDVTDAAVAALVAAGFDPDLGARPLRRAVTTMLVDQLSEAILERTVVAGMCAQVDVDPDSAEHLKVTATTTATAASDAQTPLDMGDLALEPAAAVTF